MTNLTLTLKRTRYTLEFSFKVFGGKVYTLKRSLHECSTIGLQIDLISTHQKLPSLDQVGLCEGLRWVLGYLVNEMKDIGNTKSKKTNRVVGNETKREIQ